MTDRNTTTPGNLYIVGTPIGNLHDMSKRAIDILHQVDKILAEDTRHSKSLLQAYDIRTPVSALHAHNEHNISEALIDALKQGVSMAIISDAGTPLISDPGYPLVVKAHLHQIKVIPIPGPCAFVAALSAAGIACDTFTFHGFMPAKQKARLDKIASLKHIKHTHIFYESTHRLLACLYDFQAVYDLDIEIVLAKELTKHFETIKKATISELISWFSKDTQRQKGEFVLLIPPQPSDNQAEYQNILQLLLKELPFSQAVKLTTKITHQPKNEIYQAALAITRQPDSK